MTLISHCYLLGAVVVILIAVAGTISDKSATFHLSSGSSAIAPWYLWFCGALVIAQMVAAYLATCFVQVGSDGSSTAASVWPAPDIEAPAPDIEAPPTLASAAEELRKRARYEPGMTVLVILPGADFAVGYRESNETTTQQVVRRGVISPEEVEEVEDLQLEGRQAGAATDEAPGPVSQE